MPQQPSKKIAAPKSHSIKIKGITYTFYLRNVTATQGKKTIYQKELFSQTKINPLLEKDVQINYITAVKPTENETILLITIKKQPQIYFNVITQEATKIITDGK